MSSEQKINLYELLNLSIRPPQRSGVDFSKLHDLLKAVLTQLEQLEQKTRCSGEQQNQDGTSEVERAASTQTPSSDAGADGRWGLQGGDGTCEEDASKEQSPAEATMLLQEFAEQREDLREEMKELRDQVRATAEACTAMENCRHRVDALEEILRSLRDACQRSPHVRELFKSVTWNQLLPKSLPESDGPQMDSELMDPFTLDTSSPSSSSEPQQQCSPETAEAMSTVSNLMEKCNKLETLVAGLETGKVDESQLTHLIELIDGKGSLEATKNLTAQLNEQRALIDYLMSDREKLNALEEMIMNPTSSEPTSESVDPDSKLVQKVYAETGAGHDEGHAGFNCGSRKYDHLQDQNVELVNSLQRAVLQLQADCEKLQETTRCLHKDNLQKQSCIEALCKTTEELEEKKADKMMIEETLKTDRSSLDSKVNQEQFDSVTKELYAMYKELHDKVEGQEKDWHDVISRLSTEMESKLSGIEFEPMKKALEDHWNKVLEELQALEAADAAVTKRQLLDTFRCLSCDQPVPRNLLAPSLLELPVVTTPAPQFKVKPQEKIRPINRSKPFSEVRDHRYRAMVRSCCGKGTIITRPMMFRNLKKTRDARVSAWRNPPVQLEQAETAGNNSYQGHLNEPASRNTKTKSPTSSTKEDKARCSPDLQPSASLETTHGSPLHHRHSGQVSHSGTSDPPAP